MAEPQLTSLYNRVRILILNAKATIGEYILATFSRELIDQETNTFLNADQAIALGYTGVFQSEANGPGGLAVIDPDTGLLPGSIIPGGGGGGGGGSIAKNTYTQNLFSITGQTGGGATNLDGMATAGGLVQANYCIRLGDAPYSLWRAMVGSPGAVTNLIVYPLDRSVSNLIYWQRIG
jgi:hypothetical protein